MNLKMSILMLTTVNGSYQLFLIATMKQRTEEVNILSLTNYTFLHNADSHQEKIVEEGGLEALLMLLRSSQNITILRVAAGAIANLAMNGIFIVR